MDDFFMQKIIWKRIGSIIRFSFDENQNYGLDSTCILTGNINLKYLVLLLNSKIGHYQLRDAPKTGTGDLLISVQAIQPLKFPLFDNKDESKVDDLYNGIKNQRKNIESDINYFIYQKFEFDSNEIEFIDSQ